MLRVRLDTLLYFPDYTPQMSLQLRRSIPITRVRVFLANLLVHERELGPVAENWLLHGCFCFEKTRWQFGVKFEVEEQKAGERVGR